MAFLRQEPELLQNPATAPLSVSLDYLHASVSDYREGNHKAAYDQAVAAYLEGFELVETKLNTMAPDLRTTIEQEMMAYRSQIKAKVPTAQVEQQYKTLIALLDRARNELQADYASPFVSFFAAALILLREGLEAILVLAAIIALLVKGGRRDAVRYIHAGWMVALLLGVFTWFVAEYLFDVSGASREITEGVTALVAAGMLLYVGFWLHNQSHSQRWQQFIRDKISNTLGTGTLWGLTFVAFMAVYREIFETILFYRSMWMSAQPVEHNYLISGIISAAAMLVLLAWMVMRLSVRLPLKRFFKINTVLMFLLAVIFAGKGVAALQEAGTFPLDPVNFPRVDMLGIYPNLESLGAQFLLLAGVGLWWLYGYMRSKRVDSMGV
jgi:high-affinity iron transporter